jgi:hypothetical protein
VLTLPASAPMRTLAVMAKRALEISALATAA